MAGAISFPDADLTVDPEQPFLNCTSDPMRGLRVKVEGLGGVHIGAEMKLTWQGFKDREFTIPVPGTLNSEGRKITEDDVTKGFVMTIGEYFQHLKPIQAGWGKASYTINGESADARIRVYLRFPNGDYCDEVKK